MSIGRLLPQQTRPNGGFTSHVSRSDRPSCSRSHLEGGYLVDECSGKDRGVGWARDWAADIDRQMYGPGEEVVSIGGAVYYNNPFTESSGRKTKPRNCFLLCNSLLLVSSDPFNILIWTYDKTAKL